MPAERRTVGKTVSSSGNACDRCQHRWSGAPGSVGHCYMFQTEPRACLQYKAERVAAPSDLAVARTALGNLLAALMRHNPRGTATEIYQTQLDIAYAMDEGKRVMGFPSVTASSGVCTWTRLPDATEFGELRRFRYNIGCLNKTATGRILVYPDVCPHCRLPVSAGEVVEICDFKPSMPPRQDGTARCSKAKGHDGPHRIGPELPDSDVKGESKRG